MEVIEKRSTHGYVKPVQEIYGKVEGFTPGHNRVLIRLQKTKSDTFAGTDILRPEMSAELILRGEVVSKGACDHIAPPLGAVATISSFCEEKHFDDEGEDRYYLANNIGDIRGWHECK